MKYKGAFLAAILTAVLFIGDNLSAATYGGGTGEPNDPYLIWTPEEMNTIGANSDDWGKCFKLMADVDMSAYTGTEFNIIGSIYYEGSFTGVFDGNGHTIRELTFITAEERNDVGLFGGAYGATIKNLNLENVNISSAGNFVGGLVGWNWGSTIERCSVQGTVSGNRDVGLLAGANDWIWYTTTGLVDTCFAEGTVSGNSGIGGLVGVNVANMIQCYADVATAGMISVGGLVGENWVGSISDSYAMGSVVGQQDVGGLVGLNSKNDYDGSIRNCYSIGVTNGVTNVGGLVGYNGGGNIDSSFWDTETAAMTDGVGDQTPDPAGAVGKTTEQMQTQSTFTDAGWDFDTPVWVFLGQGYPKVIWNNPDINNSGRVDSEDFAILSSRWMDFGCGLCDKADLTGDRNVNLDDLIVFTTHWLDEDTVSNHVSNIGIATGWDYQSPSSSTDDQYEIIFEITTDNSVERIEFLTPAGQSYEITTTPLEWADQTGEFFVGRGFDEDAGVWGWLYEAGFVNPDSLDAFGDGEYIFTIYYEGGRSHQTSVWFVDPGTVNPLPQPVQQPTITNFDDGATVIPPVYVNWQACAEPDINHIYLNIENVWKECELKYEFDPNATGTGSGLHLGAGRYDINLDFVIQHETTNSDGVSLRLGKYSESDYEITVTWRGSSAFVTTWDTSLGAGTTVSLGLDGDVDATIDWGDGSIPTIATTPGPHMHDYGVDGIYSVSVIGSVEAYNSYNCGASERDKLISVDN